MTITYLILAHGEPSVLELIDYIKIHRDEGDKIVVLNDPTTGEFRQQLNLKCVKVVEHKLEKDYSAHRNSALSCLKTDYTFALDADEVPHFKLMKQIKGILADADYPEIVNIPRYNIFDGVLPVHCLMYGWTLKDGIVQWPDYQSRLFKNKQGIKWVGALHEGLKGQKNHRVVNLPKKRELTIIHHKNMTKQIADNARYAAGWSAEENAGLATKQLLTK